MFLGSLTAFFAVLILLLILLLQSFLGHLREATFDNWSNVAQSCVTEIVDSDALGEGGQLEARLSLLQARYGIAGITVARRGRVVTAGVPPSSPNVERIVRTMQGAVITFVFDASTLKASTTTFWATTIISLTTTALVSLLLLFYLPRITGPIEHMLGAAAEIEERTPGADEQQYLISTFRKSIDTLKAQETELQRMHDVQKSRADDLERVTAALTRSLTSGFLAVDPEGRVIELNAAAREILQPQTEPPASLEELFGRSPFTDAVQQAIDDRVGLTRVEVELGEGSSRRVIGLTSVPLIGQEQQFLGALTLFTDLTHIRGLESRIRELQTLADLGEISAGIAHEFRNSLAAIIGNLRLAQRDPLPERPLGQIERAQKEAVLLADAVDALLAFARPMRLTRMPLDLLELASEVVSKIDAPPGVALTAAGESVQIEGDPALLSRALENLVRNSVESVQQKGEGRVSVLVSASPRPAIRVEDDGVGIDPADVARLMLPFQSDKPTGYGLGLALSRKIALLHGATLQLTGERGRGAVATLVFLPEDGA